MKWEGRKQNDRIPGSVNATLYSDLLHALTLTIWAHNRGNLNSCVCSTPPWGREKDEVRESKHNPKHSPLHDSVRVGHAYKKHIYP